jgi:hypothetical protein
MNDLKTKFKKIQNKYQSKIKALNEELKEGYFHTFLNLRQQYGKYINELNDLFDEYEYIVPYEIYKTFFEVSLLKYKLLIHYAKYVEGSGNLPGCFLKEANRDLKLWSITTLLFVEQKNEYTKENATIQLLSIKAYDAILENQKLCKNLKGYALSGIKVSEEYATAASEILSFLGASVADKAYEYYNIAIKLLKETAAEASHNSITYYTYYITMFKLLSSYKDDINEYGIKCDFDIDQEIYECLYKNYRQAQVCSRDKMIIQVNNLVKQKRYDEAMQIAKEIIDICEERAINIQVKGVKLSLKNAYELYLSIPGIGVDKQSDIRDKLNNLIASTTRDEYYCMDGEKENPLREY